MPQQFVVPQFIDVEDKIFGPVTTRQFLIMLSAALILFIFFKLLDFSFFLVFGIPTAGLAFILAFVKVNGQTFHYFLLNIVQTLRKPGLRVWNKGYTAEELNYLMKMGIVEEAEKAKEMKTATHKRVRDLALVVNTGGFYNPEE